MPVTYLQYGGITHMRSVIGAFDVDYNGENKLDPFGLSKLYVKIESEYTIKESFYNEDDMMLGDFIFFRF